jgi:hypothetical protein
MECPNDLPIVEDGVPPRAMPDLQCLNADLAHIETHFPRLPHAFFPIPVPLRPSRRYRRCSPRRRRGRSVSCKRVGWDRTETRVPEADGGVLECVDRTPGRECSFIGTLEGLEGLFAFELFF